jgi:hypothetical protein
VDELRTAAIRWNDPRSAARAGYDTTRPRRKAGNNAVMWFHAEAAGSRTTVVISIRVTPR